MKSMKDAVMARWMNTVTCLVRRMHPMMPLRRKHLVTPARMKHLMTRSVKSMTAQASWRRKKGIASFVFASQQWNILWCSSSH